MLVCAVAVAPQPGGLACPVGAADADLAICAQVVVCHLLDGLVGGWNVEAVEVEAAHVLKRQLGRAIVTHELDESGGIWEIDGLADLALSRVGDAADLALEGPVETTSIDDYVGALVYGDVLLDRLEEEGHALFAADKQLDLVVEPVSTVAVLVGHAGDGEMELFNVVVGGGHVGVEEAVNVPGRLAVATDAHGEGPADRDEAEWSHAHEQLVCSNLIVEEGEGLYHFVVRQGLGAAAVPDWECHGQGSSWGFFQPRLMWLL
jgi:hypothetical protein